MRSGEILAGNQCPMHASRAGLRTPGSPSQVQPSAGAATKGDRSACCVFSTLDSPSAARPRVHSPLLQHLCMPVSCLAASENIRAAGSSPPFPGAQRPSERVPGFPLVPHRIPRLADLHYRQLPYTHSHVPVRSRRLTWIGRCPHDAGTPAAKSRTSQWAYHPAVLYAKRKAQR